MYSLCRGSGVLRLGRRLHALPSSTRCIASISRAKDQRHSILPRAIPTQQHQPPHLTQSSRAHATVRDIPEAKVTASIPAIDFSAFRNGSEQERRDVADRVTGEFKKHGATRLITHGISAESVFSFFKSCIYQSPWADIPLHRSYQEGL